MLASQTMEFEIFFSQANQLIIQFIFLEDREFEIFKDKVKCPWIVEKKMVSSGHTVKTIKSK